MGTVAVPLAPTDSVPLAGLTVTPEDGLAVQLTDCELPVSEDTDSVAVAVAPGWMSRLDGLIEAVSANTGP